MGNQSLGVDVKDFALCACLALLSACGVNQDSTFSSPSSRDASMEQARKNFRQTWDDYVLRSEQLLDYELQDGCRARIIEAQEGVPFIGTFVAFHGYTACNQQYIDLAELLATQGVTTILPVLPGHGASPAPTEQESDLASVSSKHLPELAGGDWRRYQSLVQSMNQIMSKAPGLKMVGGFSVGGALAAHSIAAEPDLYDRALVVGPFFGIPGKYWGLNHDQSHHEGILEGLKMIASQQLANAIYHIQNTLIWLSSRFKPLEQLSMSWGEDCYIENSLGRAGICDFYFKNLAAAIQFGRETLEIVQKSTPRTSIQVVGVEYDDGADTKLIKEMIFKFNQSKSNISSCFYPTEWEGQKFPHSFFSPYDNPGENLPWLSRYLAESSAFLVHGRTFSQGEVSIESNDFGLRRCLVLGHLEEDFKGLLSYEGSSL